MANNWAIVIGINHYDHHPERQLKYAVPDAQLIHNFLCNHAGFASDHVLLCLGDQEHRTSSTYPTYSTLLRLLNRDLHPDRMGQVDRLWFFFGGHGVSQNGRDYLLTADSLVEDVELKIALPIDEVIASLRKHQAADIVLILDNCRQQKGSRTLVADEVGRQTIELAHSRGITTIFSCDYGQYSYELDSLKHGVFTFALVEGLKQDTLLGQLEHRLQYRVEQLNRHRAQTPRVRIEPVSKANHPLLPEYVSRSSSSILQTTQPLVFRQLTRQQFLKWVGLGGAGLVTAVVSREIFKNITPSESQPNVTPSPKPQLSESPASSSAIVSVAAPKYTQLTEEVAKGLPLWKVDFETVTVDEGGQVTNRSAQQTNFFKEDLGNGVISEMIKIPDGSFKMGSSETEKDQEPDELPQHTVNVPSFFMGKFAVTQAQYQQLMGNNPAQFKGEKRPIEKVTWNDAGAFCTRLSQQTGRPYRLPSEAEWEYACRAGTTTPFHFGETITSALANYNANIVYRSEPKGEWRQQTTEVGKFPPNAFGLYDMHGNVWEWCQDHRHDNYQGAPTNGSAWLSEDKNARRLLRGGSWFDEPQGSRSANRPGYINFDRLPFLGFRVVCSLA